MAKLAGCSYLLLLVVGSFLLTSCFGRDPTDAALDRLDLAISAVEKQLTEFAVAQKDQSAKDNLKQRLDTLAKAGTAMQLAYAPVRDFDLAKISSSQEKRRSELQGRAVAAAADLLNILLAKVGSP